MSRLLSSSLSLLSLLALLTALFPYVLSFRCFSTACPGRADICIELCPEGINKCHTVRRTNSYPVEMRCTNTPSCSQSSDCVFETLQNFHSLHYCCCTGDLCNRLDNYTDSVDPILNVTSAIPTVPVPVRPSDVLICERYNCSFNDDGICYHGYEVCPETFSSNPDDHSCIATYHKNPTTNLIELMYKGCRHNRLPNPLTLQACSNSTSMCHIDNPLVSDQDSAVYYCCCGESLCNQNITFTHPTQVSTYGLIECSSRNCTHSCRIINNVPECYCPTGYALFNDSSCTDIDECAINNGGCSETCINTPGNYSCECNAGRYLSPHSGRCEDNDGIICLYRNCTLDGSCHTNTTEHCASSHLISDDLRTETHLHYCVALFHFINGTFYPNTQSCFAGSHSSCQNTNCTLTNITRLSHNNDVYSCCCYGDLCNERGLIFPDFNATSPIPMSSTSLMASSDSITIFLSSSPYVSATQTASSNRVVYPSVFAALLLIMVLILCSISIILCRVRVAFRKRLDMSNYQLSSPSPTLYDSPEFMKIIGHGRFARVYHARMGTRDVAIKIFNGTLQAKGSWTQEKDIYATERLEHENILKFLYHDHRFHEGQDTLWLIFDYHSNGSLYDYLQLHRLTFDELFSLCLSGAAGLEHLHSVDNCPETYKPAIAHRDLKSKNILVKKDMTCCISDFGLAIKFDGVDMILSEAKGQVGTSRYMAPEILEGAVRFNQEAFLKIDIYAFGLILWEMLSCCDLNNITSNPSYYPPFDGWVSANPSIDEMKRIVVEEKKRPPIPQKFQTNLKYSFIADIIVECWDDDADGRPAASLISRRLSEFQTAGYTASPHLPPLSNKSSKESGFHSLSGQPLLSSSGVNNDALATDYNINTPLPPTPTPSSPSITLSPTEIKSHTVHDFSSSSTSSSSCPTRSSLPIHFSPAKKSDTSDPRSRKAVTPLRSNPGKPTDLGSGNISGGDLFSQYDLSSSSGAGDVVSPLCDDVRKFSLQLDYTEDFKPDNEENPTETTL